MKKVAIRRYILIAASVLLCIASSPDAQGEYTLHVNGPLPNPVDSSAGPSPSRGIDVVVDKFDSTVVGYSEYALLIGVDNSRAIQSVLTDIK